MSGRTAIDRDAALAPPSWRRWRGAAGWIVILIVTGAGLATLHALLREVRPHDMGVAFTAVPTWRIVAAIDLTGLSYFVLTGYDVIALCVIGKRPPWRIAATNDTRSRSPRRERRPCTRATQMCGPPIAGRLRRLA